MHTALAHLIDRLDRGDLASTDVIEWSSPVVSFGDLRRAQVASVGLNPSNREFVDQCGHELEGNARRFHTLRSLGIESWSDTNARHLAKMLDSCVEYFERNPYDRWFRRLEVIFGGTGASFYSKSRPACHLDLIPYATAEKWTALSSQQRDTLLATSEETFGDLIRDSEIAVLILNGQTVVNEFERMAGVKLNVQVKGEWALPRKSGPSVTGLAYEGGVEAIGGVPLGRALLVLGYNHNLQSSFGVTNYVVSRITAWIGSRTRMLR